MKKRFLSMLLVVCMVLSITPTSTFAEISPQVDEGNVCTHHIHDEKCGYTQALAQVDCDKNCTDTNGDGVIDHTADCAYSPAVAENKCNFDVASCEICHPKNGETADAGTALPSEIPVLAKTDAPTTAMATVAKETAIQPSVSFVLDNETAYTDTATWAVYDSETATTALLDVVASCNANTLTLAHKTDLPVAVYYVAVTESGKAESARLALTVEGNVAPVALLGAVAATSLGGVALDTKLVSGTTYTVANADELAKLATLVNDDVVDDTGYVVNLTGNITLPSSNWTPIGTDTNIFNGTFDGCGFEVQNLTLNDSTTENQGLFGFVGRDGTVRNVGVTGNVRGFFSVGGIVGNNAGSVQNCYSTVNVNGKLYVGGVVGNDYMGTVQNCYSTGNVTGTENVGGVIGASERGTVQNCYSTGNVTGTENVGGVVGSITYVGSVLACVSLGLSNTGRSIGRVVGFSGGSTLTNNKARSDMLVNNETVTSNDATSTNGSDVTVGDTTTQASVFSGWDTGVWTIPADNLVAGATLPTLKGFENAQTPTLPSVVNEEPKPLDDSVTTLELGKIYTVATKEQLARLATLVNDDVVDDTGYVVNLTGNIVLPNSNWTPIGTYVDYKNNKPFKGTFDGNGFEVQNLTINDSTADYQGLFCAIGIGGIVQNVGVTGTISGKENVGGVAGYNEGSVRNCYSTVTVNGNNKVSGGVVGFNGGTVENCYNSGNVTGNNGVGGVVGENYTTVKNCYNIGTVTGNNGVGGVMGFNLGTVQNCYNTGTVTGSNKVGGVVGVNLDTVQNCVSLGASNTGSPIGRVVGVNDDSLGKCVLANNQARSDMLVNNETVISNNPTSTNGANVTVGTALQTEVFENAIGWDETIWTIPAGNLVAGATLPTLKGFTSTQNPTLPAAAERVIPLEAGVSSLEKDKTYTVANATQLAKLASLVNDATDDGTGYTVKLLTNIDLSGMPNWTPIGMEAGKVIKHFNGTFDGCGFEVKNLTIDNTTSDRQGLFGVVGTDGTVKNVGVTGNVNGDRFVGGVVADNQRGTVKNCYSTVTVNGKSYVGGLVGSNNSGTVKNCYSTGNVTGEKYVGGVAGSNDLATLQNCYSTATVTGKQKVGGVIGDNYDATVKNCVSLGLSVLRTDGSTLTTFGRVIGKNSESTPLVNNKARSGQYVIDGTVTGGALDDINGEPFDVGDGTTQASVFTAAMGFTTANGWNVISGNLGTTDTLPTLAGFVSMQKPTVPQKAVTPPVTPPAPTTAPTATPTTAPTIAPTATPTPKATVDGNETQKPKPTTQKPTTGKTTAAAEVDTDGKATVTVPEKSITDAITKAQAEAKKNGTEQNGISVEIEISGENINSVSTTLGEESIKELVDAGVKEVTFKSEMGDITIDLETLQQIQKEQGDITISVNKADVSTLDEKLKEEIGDRPVYELNLTKADGTRVTNFDGSITIAIPYTLQEGEDPANIAVVYINEKGEKEVMSGSGYDEKTQSVIFTTRHFSTFAIVLMPAEIDVPLTDIEQAEDTTTDLGNANETANTQGGISTGIVVTIVIAGILAIAIVAVGVVAIVKKRKE